MGPVRCFPYNKEEIRYLGHLKSIPIIQNILNISPIEIRSPFIPLNQWFLARNDLAVQGNVWGNFLLSHLG